MPEVCERLPAASLNVQGHFFIEIVRKPPMFSGVIRTASPGSRGAIECGAIAVSFTVGSVAWLNRTVAGAAGAHHQPLAEWQGLGFDRRFIVSTPLVASSRGAPFTMKRSDGSSSSSVAAASQATPIQV